MTYRPPRGRALRRHHLARIRVHRRHLQCHRWKFEQDSPPHPRVLGRIGNTGSACSCWMCGNPRKEGLLTLAERRHEATWVEGLLDQ